MTATVYRELGALRRVGLAFVAAGIVLALADVASGFGLQGWGVLSSIFVLVVGIAMWSVGFFGGVDLTSDRLLVGREHLTPDDLDPDFGAQPIEVLSDRERLLAEDPLPIPRGENVRVAGGAFGRTLTLGGVVLREAGGGKRVVVFSRRPEQLAARLQEWLTHSAR